MVEEVLEGLKASGLRAAPTGVLRALAGSGFLLLAELPVLTATALAATCSALAARQTGSEGVAAAFGDDARATADEPLHLAAASRARVEFRVRHLLALLKPVSTRIAPNSYAGIATSSQWQCTPPGRTIGRTRNQINRLRITP